MPGLGSETFGIWIGSGSRSETDDTAGSTHFLEHMLFKGTRQRTAKDIAREFDRLGGEANAVTAKEYTAYYARCLIDDLDRAAEVLCDMVFNSLLDPVEFERERKVIIDELAMAADDPVDVLYEHYDSIIYRGSGLGRPVGATKQRIAQLDHSELVDYYAYAYTGPRIVIAAAGGAEHEAVVEACRRAAEHLPDELGGTSSPVGDTSSAAVEPAPVFHAARGGLVKPTEQQVLLTGVQGLHLGHPDRFTLAVLQMLLGGGMSSRLFQSIREDRGLAYSVHCAGSQFSDIGDFGIYAGCAPEDAPEVLRLIRAECAELAENGPSPAEVADTASASAASAVLAMESSAVRMNRLGRSELTGQPLLTTDEIVERTRSVTPEDVRELAARLFGQEWAMATVGPRDDLDF